MDEPIAKRAAKMDITERLAMADELERRAAQYRGFQGKHIEPDTSVTIQILPSQKKVCQYWAKMHGDDSGDVDTGARWILEIACTMIDKICDRNHVFVRYRDAEGILDSHLCESWTEQSLGKTRQSSTTTMTRRPVKAGKRDS